MPHNLDPAYITAPASTAVDVTASDSTTYSPLLRAFRVYTTAGDVYVLTQAGDTVKIGNVQVGERIDLICSKILSTGPTTAAGITGFR